MTTNDELAGRMARMDAARAKPQRPNSILVEQGASFWGEGFLDDFIPIAFFVVAITSITGAWLLGVARALRMGLL